MKHRLLLLTLLAGLLPSAPLQAQSKDLATLVEGNNQFALDLYQQLGRTPGNKFFSPYSISTALGMTYAGAKAQTAREMAGTLHFALDSEHLHPAFGDLIRQIQGTDKKRNFQLTTANSLWGNKSDLNLNANFLRITLTDYQSGFHLVNFATDADGTRKEINAWVEDKTNNKIKELLLRADITPSTRLVLVNAIYFKGPWLTPFSAKQTTLEEFTVPGSPAVKVPTMHHTFFVNYLGNDDFQLAQLPYTDNEASMVIILPKKKNGLPEVEKKLSPKMLLEALAQAKRTNVEVSLPKFKMTDRFSLVDELKALGMNEAFIGGVADFTGMEDRVSPGKSLFISDVIHKAFVDVHEEGTEAAAATAVIMGRGGRPPEVPPAPIPFNADHPFLFFVRHNATGSILFMGRVNDPRGESSATGQ
jgi:serpin B